MTHRTQATRKHRATAGFTLVELLVALTLFGVLSVGLFGSLRFGTAAWEAGAEQSAALDDVLVVQSVIRRHLALALPPETRAIRADQEPIFIGDDERLSFVAPLSNNVGLGGLYRFTLTKIEDDGQMALQLDWILYRPDRDSDTFDEQIERRTLLDGLEDVAFRYYGRTEGEREPNWHSIWPREAGSPILIALAVEMPEGDRRSWPELVVAPKLFLDRGSIR